MSQLQLYKGLKSEYSEKKDKIADGGLVITKKENNSSVGNLYINDGGTHVQLSSDEAVINVVKSEEDNKLIVSKINGESNVVLTVDDILSEDSNNPIENKAVYTKFELQDADIEKNVKIPLNTLIGNDKGQSVRDISIDVLTEQLVPKTAQESLDTLEEIADWIQKHPEDAAAMNTAIQNNAKDIDDIQLDIMRLDVQPDWDLENDQSHAYIKDKPPIKKGAKSTSITIGDSIANGEYSLAEGFNTIAEGYASHVQGQYNIKDNENKYAHIVGGGIDDLNRKNIHTVDWNGNAWYKGDVYVGGTSPDDGKRLATENYVNEQKPIFIATYGTTTYEELMNAYEAKKQLVLRIPAETVGGVSEMYANLMSYSYNRFDFVCLDWSNVRYRFYAYRNSRNDTIWEYSSSTLAEYTFAKIIDDNFKNYVRTTNERLDSFNMDIGSLFKLVYGFRGGFRNMAGTLDINASGIYLVLQGGSGNKTMTIAQDGAVVYKSPACNGWIVLSSDTGVVTPIGIKSSITLAGSFETPGTYVGWGEGVTTKITYPAKCVIWYLGNSNNV